MFTNKKREGIRTFVRAISLYVTETPKASIKEREPLLPIIPFGVVAYGFVGQPFSKQLYTYVFSEGKASNWNLRPQVLKYSQCIVVGVDFSFEKAQSNISVKQDGD